MRRIVLGLGILFLALSAIVATAAAFRFPLAALALRYGLARAGFADSRFTIERLTFRELAIAEVEAGEALRARRIEVTLDLRRLPRLPIEKVRIVDADVKLPSPAAGATPAEKTTSSAAFPLGLVPALELENLVVSVPTDVGPVSVRVDSRVTPGDELRMELDALVEGAAGKARIHAGARLADTGTVSMDVHADSLQVRHPKLRIGSGSATLRFEGESSGLDIERGSGRVELALGGVTTGATELGPLAASLPLAVERHEGRWMARLSKGEVRLPAKGLDASGISGEASLGSVDVEIGRLADTSEARRFEPFSLHVRVPETEPAVRFVADAAAADGAAAGRAALHVEGGYEPSRGVAHATVACDGLSTIAAGIRIDGLTGKVDLPRLFPPETSGVQTLSIHEIHSGVLFTDATLQWALERAPSSRGSRLRIERFDTGFAGGRIVVADTVVDPHAATNRIVFQLEDVDLDALLQIAKLEGVSATGRLAGTIPVSARSGAVAVEDGKLEARDGVLRMRSQKVASLLAGGGESVGLLLDVLRDFHYEKLAITIDKGFVGEAAVVLHLEGQNPEVMQGQPFHINLNLTGNLDRLVASLLEVARLSDRAVRATVQAVK